MLLCCCCFAIAGFFLAGDRGGVLAGDRGGGGGISCFAAIISDAVFISFRLVALSFLLVGEEGDASGTYSDCCQVDPIFALFRVDGLLVGLLIGLDGIVVVMLR